MRKLFTKKQVALAIFCALVLGTVSPIVNAEVNLITRDYVTDESKNVYTNSYGECWRTGTAQPLVESSIPCKAGFAALEVPDAIAHVPVPVPKALIVTLGVDTLFDFDKADLRSSERIELDAFISKLSDMELKSVTVIGYADRIGSDSYNQQLSEKRAQTVKNYMVSMGVTADSIQALGMGEGQPVTLEGNCNAIRSDELVVCLQPNRRVEAKVVGIKK